MSVRCNLNPRVYTLYEAKAFFFLVSTPSFGFLRAKGLETLRQCRATNVAEKPTRSLALLIQKRLLFVFMLRFGITSAANKKLAPQTLCL